ncbi:MAG TPA: hypothetical protein VKX17_22175, partial [Planctomycetota bacterium]|nr:hypothetical protein [Planctomycetota bacterium]
PDPGVAYNQQAQWDWADGGGGGAAAPVFGANNLNKSPTMWLYRYTPIDGTMAVVDEYKLAKTMWTPDLISRVMATSRYYLPKDPTDKGQCPFFTSQSMLQSLRGFNAPKSSVQPLRPIRLAWNCFTPRFMHESFPYLNPNGGPFNYLEYNAGLLDPNTEDKIADKYGVYRPTLLDYQQMGVPAHATRGIEIELLSGTAPIPGEYEKTPGQWTQTSTFIDSNVMNRFKQDVKPVLPQDLHYVVRFRYPIDPSFGGGTVDPNSQYMLDTPVFDDISITYTITPRILMFKDISE